jgi:hypothetical protein
MKQYEPPLVKANKVKVQVRRPHSRLVVLGLWLAFASVSSGHVGSAEPDTALRETGVTISDQLAKWPRTTRQETAVARCS